MLSGNNQWPLPPCSKPLCPTTCRASKGQLGTDAIQRKGGQVLAPHRTPSLAGGAGAGAGLGSTDLGGLLPSPGLQRPVSGKSSRVTLGPIGHQRSSSQFELGCPRLQEGEAGNAPVWACWRESSGPVPHAGRTSPSPGAAPAPPRGPKTSPAGSVLTG